MEDLEGDLDKNNENEFKLSKIKPDVGPVAKRDTLKRSCMKKQLIKKKVIMKIQILKKWIGTKYPMAENSEIRKLK